MVGGIYGAGWKCIWDAKRCIFGVEVSGVESISIILEPCVCVFVMFESTRSN
jgi:hypothetical protein